MANQTILFRGDSGVAASIELERVDGGALTMLARFHPERASAGEARGTYTDPAELADEIEALVRGHFAEAGSRVRTIKWSYTPELLAGSFLSRYGVPMMTLDKGGG